MHRRPLASVVVVLAMSAFLVACVAPAPTWTLPPVPSPTVAPSPGGSGEPSSSPPASAEPSASAAPSASPSPAPADRPIPGGWSVVKTEPCPNDSAFSCTTMSVPRDHFTTGGPTWDVTFALHKATGPKLGTYVVITGGPGTSGLAEADGYTFEDYPAVIGERYDVIFIDQRGVGLSHPIQCPTASTDFYLVSVDPFTPDGMRTYGDATEKYVTDCLTEAKADPADLPFYATRQAVEDLEAFLDHLDVDTITLYGESYGTQYVQAYAASHPERIHALIVDGPVDLTPTGVDWLAEQARGYDDVLQMTFADCDANAACAGDDDRSTSIEAYDALAANLAKGPIDFPFVKADGTVETRQMTGALFETAVAGNVTLVDDRTVLQRALVAAGRGNLVPLARVAYATLGVDPDTLAVIPDPTWSDAMYYAVDCQDYVYTPEITDGDARADAYLKAGIEQGMDQLRLGTVYSGELPCAYWPTAPTDETRPDPLAGATFPVFVMGATGDPSTPIANVHRIAARLANGHTIIASGGPHVIFGWGNPCPDDILAAYLENGTLPKADVTVCADVVAQQYVPIARQSATDYPDALAVASSMDDQLVNNVAYFYWEAEQPLSIGCDFGGSAAYTATDAGSDVVLTACEFTDGLPMTGTATIDDEEGSLAMTINVPDGDLRYQRDGEGERSVSGTFRGATAG